MHGPSLACLAGSLILVAALPVAARPGFSRELVPAGVPAALPGLPATASARSPDAFDLLLPSFDYTATFLAPEPDGALRAEQTGRIHVDLTNLDDRAISGIQVIYKALTPVPGLPGQGAVKVPDMVAGATASVDILLPSSRSLPTQTAEYVLEIHSTGGYYGSPARLAFQTLAFVPPKLDLVGVDIHQHLGSGVRSPLPLTRIPVGRKVELVAQIENRGEGMAHDVQVRFLSTDPGVRLSSTASIPLGELGRDQTRDASVGVKVAPSYLGARELPVWIQLSERHSDLGFRELLPIPIDRPATASVPLSGQATSSGRPADTSATNGDLTKARNGLTKPAAPRGT